MTDFRTDLGRNIFHNKYAHNRYETWADRAHTVVNAVCGDNQGTEKPLLSKTECDELGNLMADFKWLPGGRYLWYAGRKARFYNNCYLLKAEEDTREEWADLWRRAGSCLMTGGGIGIDVSQFRPKGRTLSKTGGVSSGPIPFLLATNEIGRNVMQGGSRRSAMYGSLNWRHEDASDFLVVMTGEPGFSFNFGDKQDETLRNACCEIVSEDDSDVCNLSSINMANIDNLSEMEEVVELVTKFLMCGLKRAELPYQKVYDVRQRNSRLGLGLMGMHEWLLKRGYKYEVNDELKTWLKVYRKQSDKTAKEVANEWHMVNPKGVRAIAPTGTISILAGTTSGIEPVYSVAFKRRYLTDGTRWKSEFVVDATAQTLIDQGISPDKIESAMDLAADPERRIKFQHDVQTPYVDQGISSTINLPEYGTELNNEDLIPQYAGWFQKYAPGLRGLTVYPNNSRGGQPITSVPYEEAINKRGMIFEDNSEEQCLSGVCGI